MELKIINPHEGGFVKEIEWNHEELKKEISAKMEEYKTLVFTENTIKDAKKDRADLNKLKNAFEDERKRIKKLCMDPYNRFEGQVKEITSLIEEPIRLIDAQIKEVDQQKKAQKRMQIEDLFRIIGFQVFVTLDQIWDDKWLNATVSLKNIEEQMKSRMYQIGEDIYTIQNLPEFSFESMEVYKKTLNLTMAVQESRRLSDIRKKKREHEEAIAKQKAEEEARIAATVPENPSGSVGTSPIPGARFVESAHDKTLREPLSEEVIQLDFRVWGTRDQLINLRNYMKENGLRFGKVEWQ